MKIFNKFYSKILFYLKFQKYKKILLLLNSLPRSPKSYNNWMCFECAWGWKPTHYSIWRHILPSQNLDSFEKYSKYWLRVFLLQKVFVVPVIMVNWVYIIRTIRWKFVRCWKIQNFIFVGKFESFSSYNLMTCVILSI